MPTIKLFGEPVPVVGPRKIAQVPAAKMATPPIPLSRYFRNTKAPDATAFSMLNEHANQAMLYRTKEVFSFDGRFNDVASFGVGSRARWRGAFHTSPYTHALLCRVVLECQDAGYNYDSYARLRIYSDTAEATQVASQEFHYGASPTGATAQGWEHIRIVDKFVEGLSADTDYYFKIEDVDYGRIQSISIVDLQSPSENFAGYLPQNFTSETPILDTYRENLVASLKPMWNRGGAKVLTWSVQDGTSPEATTSTTGTHLVWGGTTYGASIPGFTLDMTGKAREGQSGVPVVIKAFLDNTNASNGRVQLRDSAGNVLANVNYTGAGAAPGWYSATYNLPAGEAKYHLTLEQTSVGQTISCYAVSIYEYEA